MDFTLKPKDEEDAAYIGGQQAYEDGKDRDDNPYGRSQLNDLRQAWFTGYDDMQHDIEGGL